MSDESRSTNPASASSLGVYAPSVVTPKMLQLTDSDLQVLEKALKIAGAHSSAIAEYLIDPTKRSYHQGLATYFGKLLLKIQANR